MLSGLLLTGAVQAEEASPEAAKVIDQIEARRAEKAAAEAKAASNYGSREGTEGRTKGPQNPGQSTGAGGAWK